MSETTVERDFAWADEHARFGPTFASMFVAATSAAFLPAVLLFLVWQIGPPFEARSLTGALVTSLLYTIPLTFVILMITGAVGHGSLAENYLRWPSNICQAILGTTRNLAWFCMPMLLIYTALESFEGGRWNDSLGRLFFLATMLVLSISLWRTMRRINQFCSQECEHRSDHRASVGFWTRGALMAIMLVPPTLFVMSAIGYQFTAVQLSWRFVWTLVILMGIALITSIVSRLLLITQFRMKLRQLRAADGSFNETSLNISEISAQVNRLLRVMGLVATVVVCWQIWAGVLPAIGYLDQFQLWQSATIQEDGTRAWVTVRHLFVAAGVFAIALLLSRNLPGILEIVLLDRLPLDRGGRYAIGFVFRYLVVISGLLLSFKWLGFSWSSVQWLAAGLTVGLGFGLQEIFANLVSGIIILIERPVRVGDFVTVNGVTGHVIRMQLRATTIKDLDHRELIVPNKKFITEDVMNWTLSDPSTRIVLAVGIAYGSDTKKAQQTLIDVALKHSMVKREPPPEVVFMRFGDSTLDFELRVMIPSRDLYFQVIHELNMAIDLAFREAEIEIAFPQQDVHLHGLERLPSAAIPSVASANRPVGEPVLEQSTLPNPVPHKSDNVDGHGTKSTRIAS